MINKSLFIRILEDSSIEGSYQFLEGEKDGRYLSNGILYDKYLDGELKEYISNLFKFNNKDLKQYKFLLKHDIYDWILEDIEDYTLVSFLRTFNEIYLKELDQDILGDIYEHYLQEKKDEKKGESYRKLLGQYYTPRPIVRFMWLLVRNVLDSKGRKLYKRGEEMLDIIDPYMGSGTFLNEGLLQMKSADSGKKIRQGEVFYFFKDREEDRKIEESVTGYDINPLSCTIADINVFFRLIKSFSKKDLKDIPIKDLQLYRTNSYDLDYTEGDLETTIQMSLLDEEIRSSLADPRKIIESKLKKYDIVIANPPYGEIKPTDYMKEELVPFAYAKNNYDDHGNIIEYSDENKKIKSKIPDYDKNKGKYKDMYGFAFGVADKLVKNDGIICYITSNTYLSEPTYKWLRKYILDNYLIEFIINFNKTAEKSNSMFEPEAGIATSIILLRNKTNKEGNHKIKYLDLSDIDSIKEKYDSIADIEWEEPKRDKTDIITFSAKKPNQLDFKKIDQDNLYDNPDYIFKFETKIIQKIEKNSNFLERKLTAEAGVITGQTSLFLDEDKKALEQKIKTFLKQKNISNLNKKIKEKLEKLGDFPTYSESNIFDYVKGENIEKFYFNSFFNIYYEPDILLRPGKNPQNKLREDKLIVFDKKSQYSIKAVVTEDVVIPKSNNEVRFYYSQKGDIDYLYYCCAILNSKLMRYYYSYRMGNRYFPIKKMDENKKIVDRIINKSKKIHKVKSDYRKFKKGEVDFKSDFFKNEIAEELEIYPIEEKNDYFELDIPNRISASYCIDEPEIEDKNPKIICLNNDGLRLKCESEKIAKEIYESYIKGSYGDINELDISINITQLNEKITENLVEEIENKITIVEKEINLLIYALYLDIGIEFDSGDILNKKEILSNDNVNEIESHLENL